MMEFNCIFQFPHFLHHFTSFHQNAFENKMINFNLNNVNHFLSIVEGNKNFTYTQKKSLTFSNEEKKINSTLERRDSKEIN